MSALGQDIIKGLEQARDWAAGKRVKGATVTQVIVPETVDVRAIRAKHEMSQSEFATYYGFKLSSLQAWEQGKRNPDHQTRMLLKVIDKNPAAVRDAMVA